MKLEEIICEEAVSAVFRDGLAAKPLLLSFAAVVLENNITLAEQGKDFNLLWMHDAIEPLRATVEGFSMIARAILHFFCGKVPVGEKATEDNDIFRVTKYNGGSQSLKVGCLKPSNGYICRQ